MPRNEHQFDKPTEGRIFLEMEGADPTGLTLDVVPGAKKRSSRVSISMRSPVTIYQSIPSVRIGRDYCYVSHHDSSQKRSIFGCFSTKLDKTKLPKISFTRIANNVKFVFNGAFPVIGVIGTIEVNDDSTESMITRKNGKKGYCRMEKHRDFEFTIHESEASMSSTDKRKNERRYRFVFRIVLL